MFTRLSVMTAFFSAGVAATPLTATLSLAQSYPPPPGYSQPLQTVPGGYAPDGRGAPDFDLLEDDDASGRRGDVVLSPPGYQQQPSNNYQNQPRTYEQQGYTGPILSPDDPRYGRPTGQPVAPAYSDRGASQQQPPYADRQDGAMRPPGAIENNGPPGTVSQQPPAPIGGVSARHRLQRLRIPRRWRLGLRERKRRGQRRGGHAG